MSKILQYGNANPLDILVNAFNWDYDLVAACMNWALGDNWIEQPVKEFYHRWNERHVSTQKMTLSPRTSPEKAILAIGLLFKQKIAMEQLALRKGAKFGRKCPCHSRRNFEKCCGDLLEFYQPREYKGPPKSKSKFVQKTRRFGWFKGPQSVAERYGSDQKKGGV